MYPDKILGLFNLYGLMIAVGILLCFVVFLKLSKKLGFSQKAQDFYFYTAIAAIAIGFFSAALFQATYNYIENPSAGFDLGGGITFIGGLIGGVATFLLAQLLFGRKYKQEFKGLVMIAPSCILIAHAFGRIGCFFAGCCYGIQTDSFLGVQFPGMAHKVYPTQLFEAVFLFIMFGITLFLLLRKKFPYTMPLYVVTYGVFRFLIEYIRGDDRGEFVGAVSPSQFFSIMLVICGIVLFAYQFWQNRRQKATGGTMGWVVGQISSIEPKIEVVEAEGSGSKESKMDDTAGESVSQLDHIQDQNEPDHPNGKTPFSKDQLKKKTKDKKND